MAIYDGAGRAMAQVDPLRARMAVRVSPVSLYSRVQVDRGEECPSCHSVINRIIQFGYGNTRLVDYRIGQPLEWGGNDVGEPGHRRVRVSGHAEPCPRCGNVTDTLYEVVIEHDRLVDVHPVGRIDQELALFGPLGSRTEEQ